MDESREQGSLSNVKYAVFGLRNKTYDKYNQIGKEIDKRMEELGGKRIFPLGLGDDDVNIEKDFLSWKKDFGMEMCKEFGLVSPATLQISTSTRRQRLVTYEADDKSLVGKDLNAISRWQSNEKPRLPPDSRHPYLAQILVTKELHSPKSERSCLHVEISTHDNALTYLPGDHLGIYPENDLTMVHKLAALLKADLNSIISLHPIEDEAGVNPIFGPCTLKAALSQYYDITSIVRKQLLKVLAHCAEDDDEKKRLLLLASEDPEHQELYDQFIVKDCRCPTEVLKEFPSLKIPLDRFLEILPKLQPRFYSISSSPNKNPSTVHLTAVVVDYVTPNKRDVRGVTTHWLAAHRPDPEKKLYPRIPAFIRKNANFKLPTASTTPIIMVGPGTGLAPFRAFIQEISCRRSKQNQWKGEVILFFGCRNPDKDYIYKEELEAYHKEGIINQLIVAFSRTQEHKVYVQHKMSEKDTSEKIWKLLQANANFYVCGDARLMARDVQETLLNIIATHGNKTPEQAQEYLDHLQSHSRLLSDVWS